MTLEHHLIQSRVLRTSTLFSAFSETINIILESKRVQYVRVRNHIFLGGITLLRTLPLNKRGIPASRIALGCMGFGGGWDHEPITAENVKQGHAAVDAALSIGINMFDHADI